MKSHHELRHLVRTITQRGQFLFGAGVCALLTPVAATAQLNRVSSVAPRCDLEKLNFAYVALLNKERHKVDAAAPTAHFDKVLLVGTLRHNEKMQVMDSLFHASDNPIAELVGTLLEDAPVDPNKLARHIWLRLNASKSGHCEIQESGERSFVSVSATTGFFAVRLARIPGGGEAGRRLRPRLSR